MGLTFYEGEEKCGNRMLEQMFNVLRWKISSKCPVPRFLGDNAFFSLASFLQARTSTSTFCCQRIMSDEWLNQKKLSKKRVSFWNLVDTHFDISGGFDTFCNVLRHFQHFHDVLRCHIIYVNKVIRWLVGGMISWRWNIKVEPISFCEVKVNKTWTNLLSEGVSPAARRLLIFS